MLLAFKPFTDWLTTLKYSLSLQNLTAHPFHKNPYMLHSIAIQSFDMFGSKLGFLKLIADVSNEKGERLPGSVFLRGPSVAMLIVLIPYDVVTAPESGGNKGERKIASDERFVILTVQPRIPAGSLEFVELPAGMVDGGTFTGAAAREIKEELGLEIPESELYCLGHMATAPRKEGKDQIQDSEHLAAAVYPSAGGCDEFIHFYMYEKQVPWAQLAGNPLPVDIALPALQLFTMLEQSLKEVPSLITTLLNASVAMGRLDAFMAEPDKEEGSYTDSPSEIKFEGATLAWPGHHKPVLKELNLNFSIGLTVVCGRVGSGKTALLQAILGELDQLGGFYLLPNEITGYCAQSPWL
ncbi:hypothetical protein DL765_009824 [Monosporascus sp. GIB2]|nr:hypothetical protein DL765_009824 [Monosporascus sp. GIB2]